MDLIDQLFGTGQQQEQKINYNDSFGSVNVDKNKPNADGIVIPKSISETKNQEIVENVKKNNDKEQKKRNIRKRKEQKPDPEKIPEEKYEQAVENVRQEIEEIQNVEIPKDIDIVQAEYEVNKAVENIPNGDDIDFGDLTFTKVDKKSKAGYYKCKVSWKRSDIPEQLKKIAWYVKSQTKGMISPRIVDLIRISNTNRVQLKNSNLKLSPITIVFKPKSDRLKVNKFNRFMISVPEDYKSTKNLLIYMQDSRKHICLELTSKDFKTEEHFNQFLGDRIAEYFFVGYDVALKKIELRNVENPIMEVIDLIVKTNDFKVKPYVKDNKIYKFDVKSNGIKNDWLYLTIEESRLSGYWNIYVRSITDDDFNIRINDGKKDSFDMTIDKLMKGIIKSLYKVYNMDWKLDEERKDTHMYYQLSKPMQKMLDYIDDFKEKTNNEIGFKMEKIRTKKEWDQIIKKENLPFYYAESLYCSTKEVEFVITYLMLKVVGGDKRNGKTYIVTEDYYNKTGVKTRDPYQKRRNTILSKTGEKRNYNNGVNVYQINYTVKGKDYKYIAKTFQEVLNDTGILTKNIKFPKSKF